METRPAGRRQEIESVRGNDLWEPGGQDRHSKMAENSIDWQGNGLLYLTAIRPPVTTGFQKNSDPLVTAQSCPVGHRPPMIARFGS
jgi:hypothetical protein